MKLRTVTLLVTFARLGRAFHSAFDIIEELQPQTRDASSHQSIGIQPRAVGTRSRSSHSSSSNTPSPKTPGQGSGAGKSPKGGVSKQSKTAQAKGPQPETRKTKTDKTTQDAWAKYATHGGSSAFVGDHNAPVGANDERWRNVSEGARRSDRILSPKQASAGVVPDVNNANAHHASAQAQRVRLWLTNKDPNRVAEVEASGPGYQTVRHLVSHADGGIEHQYRAGSPSRPVTVKTSFSGPSDAYLEATNPGSPGWRKRISADQVTNMENV